MIIDLVLSLQNGYENRGPILHIFIDLFILLCKSRK